MNGWVMIDGPFGLMATCIYDCEIMINVLCLGRWVTFFEEVRVEARDGFGRT